jgi:DNA-directed RNA polymerase subunit RPC12/RpoP
MAATIVITCPKCKKQLKGPAGFVGKSVRCKSCSHNFIVKAPEAEAPKAAEKKKAAPVEASVYDFANDPGAGKKKAGRAPKAEELKPVEPPRFTGDAGDSMNPYVMKSAEELVARCPQCAKDFESPDQVICLHCGYNTDTQRRLTMVKVVGTSPLEHVMWLLPGIMCVILLLAAVGFTCFLWLALERYDKEGKAIWWVFPSQVWGSVFCGFIAYYSAWFAIRRLISEPTPPEKIKY